MNPQDMSGRTVLITGASRGIGAAAARAFADAGASLALLARDGAACEGLARDIAGRGGRAIALAADVTDAAAVAAAVRRTLDSLGSLDVAIANAGVIQPIARLQEATPEAWGRLIDINVKGVFNLVHAVLPVMRTAGGGTFITLGSGAATTALDGWSAYCSSKAAAHMLTACADLENRDHGLRFLTLSPGTVATDMQAEIRDSGVNPVSRIDWSAHIPADWAARALLWMCGPEADAHLGGVVSLRDPAIRMRIGLPAGGHE